MKTVVVEVELMVVVGPSVPELPASAALFDVAAALVAVRVWYMVR